MAKSKTSFETSLKRLEEIVAALEGQEISLEDSMALYREGSQCAQQCRKSLDAARHEMEVWQQAQCDDADAQNGEEIL